MVTHNDKPCLGEEADDEALLQCSPGSASCSMMMPALHVSKRSGLCCAHSTGLSARARAFSDRLGPSVGSTYWHHHSKHGQQLWVNV